MRFNVRVKVLFGQFKMTLSIRKEMYYVDITPIQMYNSDYFKWFKVFSASILTV